MGAVCIVHKSGSTNFLSKATANKGSRRALLNHHFVVPLPRWGRLLKVLSPSTSHLPSQSLGKPRDSSPEAKEPKRESAPGGRLSEREKAQKQGELRRTEQGDLCFKPYRGGT